VLANDVVVGRIFNAAASPVGTPWMWTLAYGFHEDRVHVWKDGSILAQCLRLGKKSLH
jgi:hypothetical protein